MMSFSDRLVDFLVKRAQKEYSAKVRVLAFVLGASLALVIIPALVWLSGRLGERGLALPPALSGGLCLACFVIGLPWMLSAVVWQLTRGKGTPVPVVPTKHFLQSGPYRYVRNPMMVGFVLYLFGWAFLNNHWGALAGACVFSGLLILEVKKIEEPELEKRFGRAYLEYKKETPFAWPRWKKRT